MTATSTEPKPIGHDFSQVRGAARLTGRDVERARENFRNAKMAVARLKQFQEIEQESRDAHRDGEIAEWLASGKTNSKMMGIAGKIVI